MANMTRQEAARKASLARTHESRVNAGKKAAATRGYDSLAAAGRKGGQHSHGGGRKPKIMNVKREN